MGLDPEDAVTATEPGLLHRALEHHALLTEREVLSGEGSAGQQE